MKNQQIKLQESLPTSSHQPIYEEINWELVEYIRGLSVAEKNERAFAAAEFALTQKRLILTKQHPDWSVENVDQEARRQVYGVSIEEIT